MKEKVKKMFISCLLKLSLGGIIPSLICAIICTTNPTFSTVALCTYISNFLILGWTVFVLFDFRIMHRGKKRFYYYNLSALTVYFAFGVGSSLYIRIMNCSANSIVSKIHTYLFFNFKCFHFLSYNENHGYGIGIARSAVYYALIYIAIALIFPLVVNKYKIMGIKKPEKKEKSSL